MPPGYGWNVHEIGFAVAELAGRRLLRRLAGGGGRLRERAPPNPNVVAAAAISDMKTNSRRPTPESSASIGGQFGLVWAWSRRSSLGIGVSHESGNGNREQGNGGSRTVIPSERQRVEES